MQKKEFVRELYKEYGQEKVLLIGFDISKEFHFVGIANGYGEIIVPPYEIGIYEDDYNSLKAIINQLKTTLNAEKMIFGCEPTGHYYTNLITKLVEDFGDETFVLINPSATKSKRDQLMIRSKTDKLDTLAILELMRNGECYDLPINEDIFNTIKEYVRILDRSSKDMVAQKNRIHAYLDEIYPGLEGKLSKFVETKYGLKLLQILPHPNDLKRMNTDDVIKMYKDSNYKIGPKLASKISEASSSLLITKREVIKDKIEILKIIVKLYLSLAESIESVELKLEKLLAKLPFSENILEISGIGTKCLSRFIAYLGNPYKFANGSKVSAFAGMNPVMNQSGKFVGRVTISRKGNKKLRQSMIQTTQLVVNNVGYFTAAYNRLIIENQKDPNLAIVAIANKLIKVLMKMIHSNEKFCPPTAQNQSLCKQKIKRLTSKELKELKKEKRLDSLTKSTVYLTRV